MFTLYGALIVLFCSCCENYCSVAPQSKFRREIDCHCYKASETYSNPVRNDVTFAAAKQRHDMFTIVVGLLRVGPCGVETPCMQLPPCA